MLAPLAGRFANRKVIEMDIQLTLIIFAKLLALSVFQSLATKFLANKGVVLQGSKWGQFWYQTIFVITGMVLWSK